MNAMTLSHQTIGRWLPMVVWSSFAAVPATAAPLATAFTYQGRIEFNGAPLDDTADFQFTLWDADLGGSMIGSPLAADGVDVVDGLFNVELDFGPGAFDGGERWLEIAVRSPAGGGPYTTLSPRQPMTAAPYALYALNGAASAWSQNGSSVYYDAGNVGIGTQTPAAPLHVEGTALASSFSLRNPDNPSASFALSWLDDVPRIRYGGSGPGSHNGFAIQGTGDSVKLRILDNGYMGIGTADPVAALDVRGRLVLDDGAGGLIYTASSGGGPASYLRLIDSPGQGTASGLKAGGVLVADSYSYAEPGKNDLIVKGRAGIGTSSPGSVLNSKLDVVGGHIAVANDYGIFSYNSSMNGIGAGVDTTSGDDLRLYAGGAARASVTASGSVGIGTAGPAATLHVASDAFPNAKITQTDNTDYARLMLDGNGNEVQLNVGSPGASLPGTFNIHRSGVGNMLSIAPNGNVGIGTSDPQAKLHVGGPGGDGAVRLPTDAISSPEMSNEPGLASRVNDDLIEVNNSLVAPSNIATCTINCPTDGFVFATASVAFINRAGNPEMDVYYGISRVSEYVPDGTQFWKEVAQPTVFPEEFTRSAPNTITGVFNVSAGDNTFYSTWWPALWRRHIRSNSRQPTPI